MGKRPQGREGGTLQKHGARGVKEEDFAGFFSSICIIDTALHWLAGSI